MKKLFSFLRFHTLAYEKISPSSPRIMLDGDNFDFRKLPKVFIPLLNNYLDFLQLTGGTILLENDDILLFQRCGSILHKEIYWYKDPVSLLKMLFSWLSFRFVCSICLVIAWWIFELNLTCITKLIYKLNECQRYEKILIKG